MNQVKKTAKSIKERSMSPYIGPTRRCTLTASVPVSSHIIRTRYKDTNRRPHDTIRLSGRNGSPSAKCTQQTEKTGKWCFARIIIIWREITLTFQWYAAHIQFKQTLLNPHFLSTSQWYYDISHKNHHQKSNIRYHQSTIKKLLGEI